MTKKGVELIQTPQKGCRMNKEVAVAVPLGSITR